MDVQSRSRYPEWVATAEYPIALYGSQTDYSLRASYRSHRQLNNRSVFECDVIRNAPAASGAEQPESTTPFTCAETRTDGVVVFTVELNSVAEASGTITATDVALTNGVFRSDVANKSNGAAAVAVGGQTRFDAMLVDSDEPFYENQARTEFAYQIVDGKTSTAFWVAGISTNFSGWSKFSADGRCAIYGSNPLEGKGRLDWQRPVTDSPYACSATGTFLHGTGVHDNGHFHATFTVNKK